ncbi:MAG: hypothetical protein M3Y71_02670, partial [Actinomycetota bacterium]|nr:hypothetical protein [Actinomycetota bacterium]
MSLDGPVLLVFCCLLVVAGLLATAVAAPRTSRTLRGLIARLGMQVGVSLLVLVLAGVALNDQFGFYASWRDLLGNTGAQDVARGGTTASGALAETAPGPGLTRLEPRSATRPSLPDPG